MGLTAFIDVAIGLIVIYLGASLMITVFNEWLSQVKEWRQQVLAKSLEQLFNGQGFAQALEKLPGLPLLSDLLKTQRSQADPILLARGVAAALSDGAAEGKATLEAVRAGLRHLPESQAKQTLTALAATCADDLERFVREAGASIDHALTNLGQTYRNRMQLVSFLLGLTISIAFNIDTLHLVDRLYTDKALRNQAVAMAEGLATMTKAEQLQDCAAEWGKDPKSVSQGCTPVARLLDATIALRQPGQAALPIGWGEGRRHTPDTATAAMLSLLGWLITAVAISFGAPFWFDLLGKLLSLRRGFAAAPPSNSNP
ncbi:MAG: hypothetical protein NT159_20985 [Proteobacteria bacterium]|nr:hypothetical protein [Pseudomonadota bacterium]